MFARHPIVSSHPSKGSLRRLRVVRWLALTAALPVAIGIAQRPALGQLILKKRSPQAVAARPVLAAPRELRSAPYAGSYTGNYAGNPAGNYGNAYSGRLSNSNLAAYQGTYATPLPGDTVIRDSSADPGTAAPIAPGYLGMTAEEDPRSGALTVVIVKGNSPAERAGIRVGDQLLAIEGRAVRSLDQFAQILESRPAGARVSFELARNGQRQAVLAVLTKRAAPKSRTASSGPLVAQLPAPLPPPTVMPPTSDENNSPELSPPNVSPSPEPTASAVNPPSNFGPRPQFAPSASGAQPSNYGPQPQPGQPPQYAPQYTPQPLTQYAPQSPTPYGQSQVAPQPQPGQAPLGQALAGQSAPPSQYAPQPSYGQPPQYPPSAQYPAAPQYSAQPQYQAPQQQGPQPSYTPQTQYGAPPGAVQLPSYGAPYGQGASSPPPTNSAWPTNPAPSPPATNAIGSGPTLNGPSHSPAIGHALGHGGVSPSEVAKELSELRQHLGTVQTRMSHLETRLREIPEVGTSSPTSPPAATPTPVSTPTPAATPSSSTPNSSLTPTPALLEP